MNLNPESTVLRVFNKRNPDQFVYAPNYWQWFSHHLNHGILPEELKDARTQLDMIKFLGLDVFSRNIYSSQEKYWFGGICEEIFEGAREEVKISKVGVDTFTTKEYILKSGSLSEKLHYAFNESTVVQNEFLIKDYSTQAGLLEEYLLARKWKFNPQNFEQIQSQAGTDGIVIVGDFYSPLKMLHLTLGPINSVYFLMEQPEKAMEMLHIHEEAQLQIIKETMENGVKVIMAMDNLDTMFHPPEYVEKFSASYYEKASSICHQQGGRFFIHACGNQKENLGLISSLGVDGLEGVAYPPMGNVELEEAFRMTPDNFIITGGISAIEFKELQTREKVFTYVRNLFTSLKPYKSRFIFAPSCNTPFNAPWETIKHFRDAWLEYKDI